GVQELASNVDTSFRWSTLSEATRKEHQRLCLNCLDSLFAIVKYAEDISSTDLESVTLLAERCVQSDPTSESMQRKRLEFYRLCLSRCSHGFDKRNVQPLIDQLHKWRVIVGDAVCDRALAECIGQFKDLMDTVTERQSLAALGDLIRIQVDKL